jgi:hypothetical protein
MIAAPAQLSLNMPVEADEPVPESLWESLPEPAQARLLSLFARLIARSVVADDDDLTMEEKEKVQ